MDVWVTKVLVLSGLFCMTFLFSLIPIKVQKWAMNHASEGGLAYSRRKRYKLVISFLSCFAAGVFLATCLLDLFPEVRVQLSNGFGRLNIITSFPVAEFVMVFGLFLILIVEQVVLTIKERHGHDLGHFGHSHSHGADNDHEVSKPLIDKNNLPVNHGTVDRSDQYRSQRSFSATSSGSFGGISDHPVLESDDEGDYDYHGDATRGPMSSRTTDHSKSIHHDPSSHSTIRTFMLLAALSLHSIFEGLAVGLQPSSDDVLQIFSALVLHKCILAFSLGLNLVQSSLSLASIIRGNLLFSVTSPVGIAIGIGIIDLSDSPSSSLINGLLQGIACGTFMYVTFFEVLPHEFNNSESRLMKLLFLILGFTTVVGLLFLHPDDIKPICYQQSKSG